MSKKQKFGSAVARSSSDQDAQQKECEMPEERTELTDYLDIVYSVAAGTMSVDSAQQSLAEKFGNATDSTINNVTFMSGRVQSSLTVVYRMFSEVAGKTR